MAIKGQDYLKSLVISCMHLLQKLLPWFAPCFSIFLSVMQQSTIPAYFVSP